MSSSKDSSSDRPSKHPLRIEKKSSARNGRAESKARLDNIERDISHLRETVGNLLQDLRRASPSTGSSSKSSRRRSRRKKVAASPDGTNPSCQSAPMSAALHSHPHLPHSQSQAQLQLLQSQAQVIAPDVIPDQLAHRPGSGMRSHWWQAEDGETATNKQQFAPVSYDLPLSLVSNDSFHMPSFTPAATTAGAFASSGALASVSPMHMNPPILADCRCGRQHKSTDECAELVIYTLITNAANPNSGPGYRAPIPRNPPVAELLLQSTSKTNPLSASVASIVSKYKAKDVGTLVAVFFLFYRLYRWRMHPSPEYLNDVPINMRPTESQNLLPHPISVDLLPWPGLRNHLCVNQTGDMRHSIQLYADSTWFAWPEDQDLVCTDASGNMALHPEFEARAGDAANWHIGSPFTDIFPHLIQYAN